MNEGDREYFQPVWCKQALLELSWCSSASVLRTSSLLGLPMSKLMFWFMPRALLGTGRLSDFCASAAWVWIQISDEPNLVIHFCLLHFTYYCTNHNFLITVTDPALIGSTGSPGLFLWTSSSSSCSAAREERGPCFHGNTVLTGFAHKEKCEHCCEHR